ncbi:hypothetical protein RND81_09G183600 [Saponaria officinalis]|uniref:Phospholipid/glycerol acyltransferase domain-containing protein n=1 Tax=Saponaria officinalis TaxID=3572 RepID=A0AAW1IPX4_SAPOF
MVFPSVLFRLVEWLIYHLFGNSCYLAATKMKNYSFHFIKNPSFKSNFQQQFQQQQQQPYPTLSKHHQNLINRDFNTMICDIDGTLLRTQSFFPYFMLVAFEGGSLIRAFLLLISYPLLSILDYNIQLRVMIFITFCGLKIKDMGCVERAVLPKFYLEELNLHVYEVLKRAKNKVVFTSVPKVMVEGFLKEYLEVDNVCGTEVHTVGKYFSGLLCDSALLNKHRAVGEYFGDEMPDVGVGNSTFFDHHLFLSPCKEIYMVNLQEDAKTCGTMSSKMPRDKYPKPLIFHDGRLAFLPTPSATLCMFMWLPLGFLLAIFRLFVGIYLPYSMGRLLGQLSGVRLRIKGIDPNSTGYGHIGPNSCRKGVLYVCTHRTLLDPVMLATCLGKKLTAVTYSLSKMSEVIAPLRTVRLTRDRVKDGETMEKLLSEGDLVVCPEGTTCREPYLLRFSSLFAELADEIVPVGLETKVNMFYGTTASGLKCLDPIFFLMNPNPIYYLNILGKVPKEETCGGGKTSFEVANNLQKQLAHAMDFECTTLTRKDKYLMLAGNEGKVTS